MPAIKNVALVSAAGGLGTTVLKHVVASGAFNVTAIRRKGSKSKYPAGIKVVDVDVESVEDLTAALKGQDAVISLVGIPALAGQTKIIDAAIAAGVHRFLPSDFGTDIDTELTRKLPVFGYKVQVVDYLIQKARETSLTYTLVSNGAFLDWGLEQNFLLNTSEYKPAIYDGGNTVFSATTLASVGDAVVGILKHPDETKNRRVYVDNIKTTQNRLLALAEKVAPNKPWAPEQVSIDTLTKASDEKLAKGDFAPENFISYIFRALFDPAYKPDFAKTDNELLGIKPVDEDAVLDILKKVIKQ
ncbi:oxidoreductase - protein [Purpureocillium lavendulum]|uniref:Oxidoreductase - protein n=1 Tax=Purpureocillium lavendulum TaxID=1247861 RepID=A0AB34FE97_9HYPO|nr:oxidoreductase - protein [Purpureocillium lavendulum]